jgi:hypothetical protein
MSITIEQRNEAAASAEKWGDREFPPTKQQKTPRLGAQKP